MRKNILSVAFMLLSWCVTSVYAQTVVTMYADCNYSGKAVGLAAGNYDMFALNARGILNDDISSLKITSGYEIVMYADFNFTGKNVVLSGDNDCLVDEGINDWISSVRIRTKSKDYSNKIQAENYTYMSGVETENTTDADGGLNVDYIDTGDWMSYANINIPYTGDYTVEYRVSSGAAGGRLTLDVNAGATILDDANLPGTGGWQNWTTVYHKIHINAGTYDFGIYAQQGGWNINWFRITYQNPDRLAFMGSSVAAGQGATDSQGYAYKYTQILSDRSTSGGADWRVSNVSIGGNSTVNVNDRWTRDLLPTGAKYVVYGLSLANEGIIGGGQAIYDQFKNNLKALVDKARAQGIEPIVANCYPKGDYNSTHYNYVKQMNAEINRWDVASINMLGALDDGSGKWVNGYWADAGHPNNSGHDEFSYAFVPSLFDALRAGKPQPQRNANGGYAVGGAANNFKLEFTPDARVHSFTTVFSVKTAGQGVIAKVKTEKGNANVIVDGNGKIAYRSHDSRNIYGSANVGNNAYHTVVLTHYYARGITLLYVDGALQGSVNEQLLPVTVSLSDVNGPAATYKEWFFYRAGMNDSEINLINQGQMLKSSLELYAPLVSSNFTENRAQSTITLKKVNNSLDNTYLIDFGPNDGNNGNATVGNDYNYNYWNSASSSGVGAVVSQLKNTKGQASSFAIEVTQGMSTNGLNNGGLKDPFMAQLNELGVPTATQDYFYTENQGELLFKGLNTGKSYSFSVFASRNSEEERKSQYIFNGATQLEATLQTSGTDIGGSGYHGNNRTVVTIGAIRPNGNGEIRMTINKASNSFAYVNCIKLVEIGSAGAMAARAATSATSTPSLEVYPNPANGVFNIQAAWEVKTVEVLDMQGKSLIAIKKPKEVIDLTFLKPGNYLLKVRGEQELTTKKIIIK